MSFYMKVSPDSDLFVQWDTHTDSVVGVGTREEFIEEAAVIAADRARAEVRMSLERAAETGTSIRFRLAGEATPTGAFNDPDPLLVMEPEPGYLDRKDLATYCGLLFTKDKGAPSPSTVLKPYEYKDEDDD